ncbi:hypothetical protein Y032_0302g1850 [Ancylostoma ceylanicum]|uniref:Secreted protein n=1 Tax=Ancylostoma ceylanicum TaxID=53326 RepID=A0A016S3J4_9BILA|nr:hypothetical protein Y032_0302g1850 [Ancylostoma ceylanicum]
MLQILFLVINKAFPTFSILPCLLLRASQNACHAGSDFRSLGVVFKVNGRSGRATHAPAGAGRRRRAVAGAVSGGGSIPTHSAACVCRPSRHSHEAPTVAVSTSIPLPTARL